MFWHTHHRYLCLVCAARWLVIRVRRHRLVESERFPVRCPFCGYTHTERTIEQEAFNV